MSQIIYDKINQKLKNLNSCSRMILEKAGFTVEELFYLSRDKSGKIPIKAVSEQDLIKDIQMLTIKTRKPKAENGSR